jgi:hypothetical protein
MDVLDANLKPICVNGHVFACSHIHHEAKSTVRNVLGLSVPSNVSGSLVLSDCAKLFSQIVSDGDLGSAPITFGGNDPLIVSHSALATFTVPTSRTL